MLIYLDWYDWPPPIVFFVYFTSMFFYLDCYHENRKIFFLTFIHEHENYRHMKIHSGTNKNCPLLFFFEKITSMSFYLDWYHENKNIFLMSIYLDWFKQKLGHPYFYW